MRTHPILKLRRTRVGGLAARVNDSRPAISARSTRLQRWMRPTVTFGAPGKRGAPCAALAAGVTALVLVLTPGAAQAQDTVSQLPPVTYTAIDGHTETLTPWQGRHVSVLVEPGVARDPRVMTRLVGRARPRLELLRPHHRARCPRRRTRSTVETRSPR